MTTSGEAQRRPWPTQGRWHWLWACLSLFTSLGTIACCALPLALVMLGLGASWAAFISDASWLIPLSQHRSLVFTIADALIFGNVIYVYLLAPRLKTSGAACSIGDRPSACDIAGRASRAMLWASAGIWLVGFSVAFLLPLAMGI